MKLYGAIDLHSTNNMTVVINRAALDTGESDQERRKRKYLRLRKDECRPEDCRSAPPA